jgi:peptide/nickel transport system ATP-binding protein
MGAAYPAERKSGAVAAGSSQALMSVRGLGIRFKTSQGVWQATRKIDFDVAPGERVGIVGESGCGKTITGLCILRLLPNNLARLDGAIMFDDIDLASCSTRVMRSIRGRRIGMIFQEPMSALDPVFTVGHQIAETLRIHTSIGKDEARAQTIDMLRRVGIASPERRVDDYPHQLSGGMRQRVMIAAALIFGPQLLIADEPTTALDVTVQAQILELLRNLSEKSRTALMLITHDLGVVAETCTRMITMYAGEVIEDAAVDAALVRPLHPYTSGLLRSLPPQPAPRQLPRSGRVPLLPTCRMASLKAAVPMRDLGCEAEQEIARCRRRPQGSLLAFQATRIAGRIAADRLRADCGGIRAMMPRRCETDPIVSVRDLMVLQTMDAARRRRSMASTRRSSRRDVGIIGKVGSGKRPSAVPWFSSETDRGRHSA